MTVRRDFYVGCTDTAMDRTLQIAVRLGEHHIEVRFWERPVFQRWRNKEGGARSKRFVIEAP